MKALIILLLLVSCGKNKSGGKNPCQSRYQKVMECYQDYNRTHHPAYVERVCGEKYPEEGCYQ